MARLMGIRTLITAVGPGWWDLGLFKNILLICVFEFSCNDCVESLKRSSEGVGLRRNSARALDIVEREMSHPWGSPVSQGTEVSAI